MSSFTVKEIMQAPAPSITSGQPLVDVVGVLVDGKTTGLPVVDKDGKVVGFVSEQDCIHSLLESSYFCEGNPVVDDVMHVEPLTVKPADSVLDLARSMGRDKPKVYPVVENGILVGLVTRNDVLNALRQEAIQCATGTGKQQGTERPAVSQKA